MVKIIAEEQLFKLQLSSFNLGRDRANSTSLLYMFNADSYRNLDDLDLDAVMECLDALRNPTKYLYEIPKLNSFTGCMYCGRNDRHLDSCAVTKATAILEQLKEVKG